MTSQAVQAQGVYEGMAFEPCLVESQNAWSAQGMVNSAVFFAILICNWSRTSPKGLSLRESYSCAV